MQSTPSELGIPVMPVRSGDIAGQGMAAGPGDAAQAAPYNVRGNLFSARMRYAVHGDER